MTSLLIPEAVEAHGEFRKRWPFGFGPRFFIALAIGLVWLVPVWWSPRLLWLLVFWDVLVVTAWLWDHLRLPNAAKLVARRIWASVPLLGRPVSVRIEIHNSSRIALVVHGLDEAPVTICPDPPAFRLGIAPAHDDAHEYVATPRQRGDAHFGNLYLRYRTTLGLAERWAQIPLRQTVCVLPDLVQAKEESLYLIRSRQIEMEKRRRQQRGTGREFESLREYRAGDDVRHICWSATARRNQLITRTYEAERSQAVWLVLDAGRLLRSEVTDPGREFPLAKLDYSVNAALALAQVASQFGDRVGLLAYGRALQQLVGTGRGPRQVRKILESLAYVHREATEANHALAARTLIQKQSRRALVVWITDFAETPTTPDVVEYAAQLAHRHLVLFAAVSQPDLATAAAAIPDSEAALFQNAAALDIVHRRQVFLRSLRQQGVLALELTPGRLTSSLVNEYLQVKDRSLQ